MKLARIKERIQTIFSVIVIIAMAVAPLSGYAASVAFDHDAQGRVTKATYSDGTVVEYSYDANGSRIGATVTQLIDTMPPSVPGSLIATAVSSTQVNLSWVASGDNVSVTGYQLERCVGIGCTAFLQIATPIATSYSDSGRSPNTTYVYRVRAIDAEGNQSGYSVAASATTTDSSAPGVPGTPVFTNVTMSSATANWSAATDDVGVTGYEYRLNAGTWQSLGNVLVVGLTELSAATSYTFEVRAKDEANNIGPMSSATFTTPDTAAPSAPGAVNFSNVAMASAIASWGAATDNVAVVGYDYRLGSGGWQSLGNVSSVGLSGLLPATSYTFQVRARDAANNLGPVSSGSFVTIDTAPPSVPGGLAASSQLSTRVNLSWSASTDNVAVAGYKIIRNGAQIATSPTTSYADNTTSGSTSYSYTVQAFDAAGNNSPPATTVTITTPDTIAPGAPGALTATAVSPTAVNLSWSASSDSGGSGLAGYRIYRNGSQINITSATSYSDTAASAGTSYSYVVRAYDNAGNLSSQSNSASVTTLMPLQASISRTTWSWLFQVGQPPPNPSNVVVTATGGSGGYTYLWQRVSGDTVAAVNTATASSTGWSRAVPNFHVDYTSVWRCRVVDSAGNTIYTPNVTVTFRATNLE